MKKESKIKNAVERVVDGLVRTLEQVKDFTLDQAPDVAKQMVAERAVELKYNAIRGAAVMAVCLGMLAAAFFYPDSRDGAVFVRAMVAIGAACGCICSLESLIESISQAEQLRVAPKVYLLNQLRRMLRG